MQKVPPSTPLSLEKQLQQQQNIYQPEKNSNWHTDKMLSKIRNAKDVSDKKMENKQNVT